MSVPDTVSVSVITLPVIGVVVPSTTVALLSFTVGASSTIVLLSF